MTTRTHEPAQSQAFAERLLACANDAALALMISIGHRTGLFDTLDRIPPATSAELALEAALDERYVREWLGALVAARVVHLDPATGRHVLPPEHAAHLCRAAGSDNLATFLQFIPVLGAVEDRIVECFRSGGGVPYSAFPRFHEVMEEESALTVVGALDEHILPLVPGLESRLRAGIDVLDVGCGRGRALLHLASRFPASRFLGYDLSLDAVEYGRAAARGRGLSNVRFEARDVTELPERGCIDLVTAFDAIHDQMHPDRVLAGIARALRADGVFLAQDIRASSHSHRNIEHPLGTYLYTVSCLHCMTVSLAGGGAGLGTCWGEETALEMLRAAGFTRVDVRRLEHDILNNYYLARP